MREYLRQFWEMRHDSSGVVRLGWWGILSILLALLVSPVPGTEFLRLVWGLWNLGLAGSTIVRALIVSRGVLRGAAASFRWAFVGSLIAFVAILLVANRQIAEFATRLSLPASIGNFGIIAALIGAPIACAVLFVFGLIGAAFGVVVARDKGEQSAAASAGVTRLWIGVMLVLLLTALGHSLQLPPTSLWAAPMSLPTFVWLLGLRSGTKQALPWDLGTELGRTLTRWFVVRVRVAGRLHYVDVRGPILGLAAGAVALALNTLSILAPLQSAELLQVVRMHSTLAMRPFDQDRQPSASEVGIVLLRLDDEARREIAEGGSETAIAAAIVERLTKLGALRIILPSPSTEVTDAAQEFVNLGLASQQDQAPVDEATASRARRDLPKLINAVKRSQRVILAARTALPLPPPKPTETLGAKRVLPRVQASLRTEAKRVARPPDPALRRVVLATGMVDLPVLDSPQLPLIPMDSVPTTPLPLAVYLSAKEGQSRSAAPTAPMLELMKRLDQVRPREVLVDFPDARVGMAFPEIDVSTVLGGGKVYERRLVSGKEMVEEGGSWRSQEDFFRGKVVFLEPLQPAYRESPLGPMPQTELLAHATRTLFDGGTFGTLGSTWHLALTLLVPALVGWICAGRDPLGAGWRLALAAGAMETMMVGLAADAIWLDSVAPLVGSIGAYLLVTQLTYATNESDRDLLRRFAAPQVVEELLRKPEAVALGGSRQKLCVLFADVRGFTQFTEQHRDQPERVIETINAYTTAMTETLFEFNGVLDKYTGDGLMAFFLLEEKEDEREAVQRSVRAALAMRDATDVVTTRLREADLQPLHVGIGMHFGEAVVGLVGNVNQFNYTALGYTVVVAARLQTLAQGGEVIVSPEIEGMIGESFALEALPPVEVKGVSEPVTPYRVLRPRAGGPLSGGAGNELPADPVQTEFGTSMRSTQTDSAVAG